MKADWENEYISLSVLFMSLGQFPVVMAEYSNGLSDHMWSGKTKS